MFYHDRWTGRGPTASPPRSPDVNPLDFYLWGHLKTLVYAVPVDNEEALHHRILDACRTICNYPGIFERMRRSMMRCIEACIESHGGHFEHLLWMYSFNYDWQIKCFRTRGDIDMFSCFGMWNSCPKYVLTFNYILYMAHTSSVHLCSHQQCIRPLRVFVRACALVCKFLKVWSF
jgi:hypothetical protein